MPENSRNSLDEPRKCRYSPDEPRKCPENPGTPWLSQDRKKIRGSTRIFQAVSKIWGRTRIEPELPGTPRIYYGFAAEIHGLPTDYPGSNRSSPDRRSVASRRQIRESDWGFRICLFMLKTILLKLFLYL